MILLNCPECGEKFSSLEEMCPECGCPTAVAEAWKNRLPVAKSDAPSASFSDKQSTSMTMQNSQASSIIYSPSPAFDINFDNGVIMRFVLIPAGTFLMGSPASEKKRKADEIQHEVTISRPFFMSIHQVTQAQYEAVMDKNPSNFKASDLPVELVSWDDAMEFCAVLSEGIGHAVRLPTEAEWEYACRAGTKTPFHFGEVITTELANYRELRKKTTSVGSFPPNAWGLYDMHGNVAELCSDYFGTYPNGEVRDPRGPENGSARVLRGGSYLAKPARCRSARRDYYMQSAHGVNVGFRVVLD